MPIIVSSSPGEGIEGWTLDGYALQSPGSSPWGISATRGGVQVAPARRRPVWSESPDADGAVLLEDPKFSLREFSFPLELEPQASMDGALAHLAALVDRLRRCSTTQGGLPLVWSPATSTKTCTLWALLGEIEDLPSGWEGGWLSKAPSPTVKLTCLPFGDLPEISLGMLETVDGMAVADFVAVPGDAPAKARLVVTVPSTAPCRHMEWGSGESDGQPNQIDSASLITDGYSGTQAGSVVTSVVGTPTAICGIPASTHRGSYRVIARAKPTSAAVALRLAWRVSDGPLTYEPWVQSPAAAANNARFELGLVDLDPGPIGAHQWSGRIEGYTTDGSTASAEIDWVELFPASDGYGVARAPYRFETGVIVSRDDFTSDSGDLHGEAALSGGTWSTSGDTPDFQSSGTCVRSTAGPDATGRFAILDNTERTDIEVSVRAKMTGASTDGAHRAVARWTDASNHLYLEIVPGAGLLRLVKVVGGVEQVISASTVTAVEALPLNQWRRLNLVVYPSGRAVGAIFDASGAEMGRIESSHADLATGGVLETGKAGFADRGIGDRSYEGFYTAIPAADPVVIHSGRAIEVRHDCTERQSADGATYGPPPAYRGSRFHLEPSGDTGRVTRLVVRAHQGDLGAAAYESLGLSTQVEVFVTPRVSVVPR